MASDDADLHRLIAEARELQAAGRYLRGRLFHRLADALERRLAPVEPTPSRPRIARRRARWQAGAARRRAILLDYLAGAGRTAAAARHGLTPAKADAELDDALRWFAYGADAALAGAANAAGVDLATAADGARLPSWRQRP